MVTKKKEGLGKGVARRLPVARRVVARRGPKREESNISRRGAEAQRTERKDLAQGRRGAEKQGREKKAAGGPSVISSGISPGRVEGPGVSVAVGTQATGIPARRRYGVGVAATKSGTSPSVPGHDPRVDIPYPLDMAFFKGPHPIAVWLREYAPHFRMKQKMFVVYYVMGDGNGAKAARLAGYSVKCANRQASENLAKPDIEGAVQGVSRLANRGGELLENVLLLAATSAARVTRRTVRRLVKVAGKTRMEEVVEKYEDPDWDTRIKAAEKAKALGEGRKTEGVGDGPTVVVVHSYTTPEGEEREKLEHPGYYPALEDGGEKGKKK